MSESGWPDAIAADELHRRLLTPNPVATLDFIAAMLDPLVQFLQSRNRGADDHLCTTIAEDVVLSVIHNPWRYDPTRGANLPAFLRMDAQGNLLNALQKEQRHQRKRSREIPVEDAADVRNDTPEDDDLPSLDDPRLVAVIARFSDVERQVFELKRGGEKRTEEFATVLGIADRPVKQQEREVKRVHDRIMKRLKRAVEGK